MDYTSRMAALLGRFRRERNGVVADTMQYRGKAYGLNYGVSLPTIRAVARADAPIPTLPVSSTGRMCGS